MEKQRDSNSLKLKRHLSKYKYLYLGIGVGLTVGVGATLVKGPIVVIKESFNNNTINITMKGHPGNVIEDLTTGVIYPSQNEAAKGLGVNASTLSNYLKGEGKDTIKGHKLVNHGMNLSRAIES